MKNKSLILSVVLIISAMPVFPDVSVGAGGDYTTIAEAIAANEESSVTIILTDQYYTESGIAVDCRVTVQGRGTDLSVIQASEKRGDASDRVFRVTENGSLTLRSITVRHGMPTKGFLRGGGIDNEGSVIMEDCVLSDNDAVYGAGLFTRGRAELYDCIISGNHTYQAPLEIVWSGEGCMGSGGGIKTEKGGDLLLENCILYNNYSIKRGGGLFVACESRAEIINTMIIENSCRQRGGGVCSKGDIILTHSTIAGNESIQRGSGFCNMGKASIFASLFADNSYGDFANIRANGIYGEGFLEANSFNLTSDGSLEGALSAAPRIRWVDSGRGNVPAAAIGWFSPARNAVAPGKSPERDFRGVLRDMRPDIGAWELRPVPWR